MDDQANSPQKKDDDDKHHRKAGAFCGFCFSVTGSIGSVVLAKIAQCAKLIGALLLTFAKCSCDPPTTARFLYLMTGVLVLTNGLTFIGSLFPLVIQTCTGTTICLGPSLVWNSNSFFGDSNDLQNLAWRQIFPLDPEQLLRNWTGVFLGLICIIVHLSGFQFSFCTKTWLNVTFFSVFVMLFGAFPYSGNLGIVTGFFIPPLSSLTLYLMFSPQYRHEKTTFQFDGDYYFKSASPILQRPTFLYLIRFLSLVAGILVSITGIIHLVLIDFNWCTTGSCVGPSLFWNANTADAIKDSNNDLAWRSVFGLAPALFLPTWGPIILGFIAVMQHVRGHSFDFMDQSWAYVFLWYLFLGLFASMGYAGNFGIIVGLFCIVISILAFCVTLTTGGESKTNLDLHIPHLSDFNPYSSVVQINVSSPTVVVSPADENNV